MRKFKLDKKIFWPILVFLFVVFIISAARVVTNESEESLECVKATCCHATECLPADQAPDCLDILCTQECVPGTIDCGQGSCQELKGECKLVLK